MKKVEQAGSKKKNYKLSLKIGIVLAFVIGSVSGYSGAFYFQAKHNKTGLSSSHIQIRFSPGGECIKFIQQTIAMAQKHIFVQAYAFTSRPIAQALIEAHQRGVSVKVLVDHSQLAARGSQIKKIVDSQIPIAIDIVLGIAHNKVMIIDDLYVLTGSFNWTNAAAYRNAENLLLITDRDVNKIYRENWEKRAANAQPINVSHQAYSAR
ncbi:MAG: hypothetical protein BGO68_00960 [Candidatus Amoebophilus sp. 36-38]|nr:MAG: hypothetical protein BGO68_00960 [Candidatus Amoebophilus sp. 36-38]